MNEEYAIRVGFDNSSIIIDLIKYNGMARRYPFLRQDFSYETRASLLQINSFYDFIAFQILSSLFISEKRKINSELEENDVMIYISDEDGQIFLRMDRQKKSILNNKIETLKIIDMPLMESSDIIKNDEFSLSVSKIVIDIILDKLINYTVINIGNSHDSYPNKICDNFQKYEKYYK